MAYLNPTPSQAREDALTALVNCRVTRKSFPRPLTKRQLLAMARALDVQLRSVIQQIEALPEDRNER